MDGRSWAQYHLGMNYLEGRNGFPADHVEGLKWLKLAAGQRCPSAICELAKMYVDGAVWCKSNGNDGRICQSSEY